MLGLFQSLQNNFHFSVKEIFNMTRFEFETMLDSLQIDPKKIKAEEDRDAPVMTIDQAFPQFFTDPNARRERNN